MLGITISIKRYDAIGQAEIDKLVQLIDSTEQYLRDRTTSIPNIEISKKYQRG
jgi:hypothetical protein